MRAAEIIAAICIAVIIGALWALRPGRRGSHRQPRRAPAAEIFRDEPGPLDRFPALTYLTDASGHAPADCPAMSSSALEAAGPHPCADRRGYLPTRPGTRMEISTDGTVTFHDPPGGYQSARDTAVAEAGYETAARDALASERLLDTDGRTAAYAALSPDALAAEAADELAPPCGNCGSRIRYSCLSGCPGRVEPDAAGPTRADRAAGIQACRDDLAEVMAEDYPGLSPEQRARAVAIMGQAAELLPRGPFAPQLYLPVELTEAEADRLAAEYEARQAGAWAAQCAEDDRRQLGAWHADEARWFERLLAEVHAISIPED